MLFQSVIHFASVRRRHYSQYDVGALKRLGERARYVNFQREREVRQINGVDPAGREQGYDVRAMSPKNQLMRLRRTGERNRQRRAPASRAYDGNFFQGFSRRSSKLGSVPAISRSIFPRCFTITSTDASAVPAVTAIGGACPGA